MNELAEIKKNELAVAAENGQIGELLKPLIREIHLFDSYIAGTTHLKDQTVLDVIKVGDKLTLQREDNKFDSNAILILAPDGRKVGYVPERKGQHHFRTSYGRRENAFCTDQKHRDQGNFP